MKMGTRSGSGLALTMILGLAVVLGPAGPLWAVKPAEWEHEQPKDWTAADLEDVVVSSRGEVSLARDLKVLLEAEEEAETINALAQAGDGAIYAAGGPHGHIWRVQDNKVEKFAKLPDGNIFSLLFAEDGRLLAGTGGKDESKIHVIDGKGNSSVYYTPEETSYVWAMARGRDGKIYAATGDEGKLWVIEPDGESGKVLADLKPKNLLCLAIGNDDMLYLGTDEEGLIYRVNPENGQLYVMYDAQEPEISSIVTDDDGNIYAATAAADQARPGRTVAEKPAGKPDNGDNGNEESSTQPSTGPAAKPAQSAATLASRLTTRRTSGGTPVPRAASGAGSEGGNAIYRIDAMGFVYEIYREPVMILDMAEHGGRIYAATGNEGRIYQINPREERSTMLARLEPQQATALLHLSDGALLVGTANAATLARVLSDYADEGTLTSEPLDAEQIVKWGRYKWQIDLPEGTGLTLQTRSGNVSDKESEAWSQWSESMTASESQQIPSPGARYLQYRVNFKTDQPDVSPTLKKITLTRIEENRRPVVSGLEVMSAVKASEQPGTPPKVKQAAGTASYGDETAPVPQHTWYIGIKASDPNQDTLEYKLYYRQVGQPRWIRLAKDVSEAYYIWDTRTVPDGRYEVRVVASDQPANTTDAHMTHSRISDPVTLDNTPPAFAFRQVESKGKGQATVQGVAEDELSPITSVSYLVDSEEDWHQVSADDDIFDSRREPVTFTLNDLEAGDHWLAVRVSDDQGNTRYVSRSITIGE